MAIFVLTCENNPIPLRLVGDTYQSILAAVYTETTRRWLHRPSFNWVKYYQNKQYHADVILSAKLRDAENKSAVRYGTAFSGNNLPDLR